jgi:hypothetical protein
MQSLNTLMKFIFQLEMYKASQKVGNGGEE